MIGPSISESSGIPKGKKLLRRVEMTFARCSQGRYFFSHRHCTGETHLRLRGGEPGASAMPWSQVRVPTADSTPGAQGAVSESRPGKASPSRRTIGCAGGEFGEQPALEYLRRVVALRSRGGWTSQ